MITIPTRLERFLESKIHHFATCWEITRTDSTVLRFTDHDQQLVLIDGNTYTPVGGAESSAYQRQSDLAKESNLEFRGIISSSAISQADLVAGRYREAKIVETLVNWMFPWAGNIISNTFFIVDTVFTGEVWTAEVEGLGSKLKGSVGFVTSKLCPYTLGDSDCKFALTAESVTITNIIEQRKIIRATALESLHTGVDDFYKWGHVNFTSGNNNGLSGEISAHDDSAGEITLRLNMPHDFTIGDTMDVFRGCDKRHSTCASSKFNNVINFGGEPYIPGADRTLQA